MTGWNRLVFYNWTELNQSYTVQSGCLQRRLWLQLVAVHSCPFLGQKTGLNGLANTIWTCPLPHVCENDVCDLPICHLLCTILYYFIQFGSTVSCGLQNRWNVMLVTGNFLQCWTRGWRNVDPMYRVGGGPLEALKFFVTLSDKNHSNGLQHYQSTLGAWLGMLHTYSVSNFR